MHQRAAEIPATAHAASPGTDPGKGSGPATPDTATSRPGTAGPVGSDAMVPEPAAGEAVLSAPPVDRTAPRWLADPATAYTAEALKRRLLGARPPSSVSFSLRLWCWLGPALTAVLAGVLRFVRLGDPHALVFDETYYVKDAYSYLQSGYERNWGQKANDLFVRGDFSALQSTPEYVVHPPVGKWMIAFGMELFGPDSSFGWRFSVAAVGTLAVFLLALIATKLLGSPTLGTLAGVLFAIDGHAIVQARTSLLDSFVMFWALVAFGALLLDRSDGRRRLATRLAALAAASGTGIPRARSLLYGPWLGIRWWRLAAGVSLGLCVGTKWSGLFFLAAFGVLSVLWDMSARRIAGIRYWITGAIVQDGLLAFASMVPVAAATYLATWTGWFRSTDAYDRQWAATHPGGIWGWVPDALRSLWEYHAGAYAFHTSLDSDHAYKANAWSWFVMGRPTAFYTQYPTLGQQGCTVDKCVSMITSLGNPLIWWGSSLAILFLVGVWAFRRDWRAGAVLCGFAAGYLPWLMYPNRTIFFFYAIAYEPYLILAVVMVLGMVLGRPGDPVWRRRQGVLFVGIFVVLALLASAYFYPIWTAETIPFSQLQPHMWIPSWN